MGLKDVVNVGELTQHIDVATQHTVSSLSDAQISQPDMTASKLPKEGAAAWKGSDKSVCVVCRRILWNLTFSFLGNSRAP